MRLQFFFFAVMSSFFVVLTITQEELDCTFGCQTMFSLNDFQDCQCRHANDTSAIGCFQGCQFVACFCSTLKQSYTCSLWCKQTLLGCDCTSLWFIGLSSTTTTGFTPEAISPPVKTLCTPDYYCSVHCQYGYVVDSGGCYTCSCVDPCMDVICSPDENCFPEAVAVNISSFAVDGKFRGRCISADQPNSSSTLAGIITGVISGILVIAFILAVICYAKWMPMCCKRYHRRHDQRSTVVGFRIRRQNTLNNALSPGVNTPRLPPSYAESERLGVVPTYTLVFPPESPPPYNESETGQNNSRMNDNTSRSENETTV